MPMQKRTQHTGHHFFRMLSGVGWLLFWPLRMAWSCPFKPGKMARRSHTNQGFWCHTKSNFESNGSFSLVKVRHRVKGRWFWTSWRWVNWKDYHEPIHPKKIGPLDPSQTLMLWIYGNIWKCFLKPLSTLYSWLVNLPTPLRYPTPKKGQTGGGVGWNFDCWPAIIYAALVTTQKLAQSLEHLH